MFHCPEKKILAQMNCTDDYLDCFLSRRGRDSFKLFDDAVDDVRSEKGQMVASTAWSAAVAALPDVSSGKQSHAQTAPLHRYRQINRPN